MNYLGRRKYFRIISILIFITFTFQQSSYAVPIHKNLNINSSGDGTKTASDKATLTDLEICNFLEDNGQILSAVMTDLGITDNDAALDILVRVAREEISTGEAIKRLAGLKTDPEDAETWVTIASNFREGTDALMGITMAGTQPTPLAQQLQQAVQAEGIEGWVQVAQRAQQLAGTDHPNLIAALQPLIASPQNYTGLTPDELEAQAEALIEGHGIDDEDEVATLRLCFGLDWGQGSGKKSREPAHLVHRLAKAERTIKAEETIKVGIPTVFSSDGKKAISGGRIVRVWDVNTGKTLLKLKGHRGGCIASLSPDGKKAITGDDNGNIKLWDVETGKRLLKLEGHKHSVRHVAFSLNGKRAITLGNSVKVWDVDSGKSYQIRLRSDIGGAHSVALSPQGRRVIVGYKNGTARIYDVKTGKRLRRLKGHKVEVFAVAFSPNGKKVITGSHDCTARIWDAKTGKSLTTLNGRIFNDTAISAVAFSSDGKWAITGTHGDIVSVWDVTSGEKLARLEGHTDIIHSVSFSSDGKNVVSVSDDSTAKIWDISGIMPAAGEIASIKPTTPLAQQLQQAVQAEGIEGWVQVAQRAQQLTGTDRPHLVNALQPLIETPQNYTGLTPDELEAQAATLIEEHGITDEDEVATFRLCLGLDWGQGSGAGAASLAQRLWWTAAERDLYDWKEVAKLAQQIAEQDETDHPELIAALQPLTVEDFLKLEPAELEAKAAKLTSGRKLTDDEVKVVHRCLGLDWGQGGGVKKKVDNTIRNHIQFGNRLINVAVIATAGEGRLLLVKRDDGRWALPEISAVANEDVFQATSRAISQDVEDPSAAFERVFTVVSNPVHFESDGSHSKSQPYSYTIVTQTSLSDKANLLGPEIAIVHSIPPEDETDPTHYSVIRDYFEGRDLSRVSFKEKDYNPAVAAEGPRKKAAKQQVMEVIDAHQVPPLFTVDLIVRLRDTKGKKLGICLIVRRSKDPDEWAHEQEKLAIPGGFVDAGEAVENAALREFIEEVVEGLRKKLNVTDLEITRLVEVASDPSRDDMKYTWSVVYEGIATVDATKEDVEKVDGSADVGGYKVVTEVPQRKEMAFDHHPILIRFVGETAIAEAEAEEELPAVQLAQQLQQAVQAEGIEGWDRVAQRAQQLAGTDHPNLVTALQPLIAQTENYSGLTPDELEAQAEALIEEHGITDEDEVATLRLCLGLDWGQGLGDWRKRWRERTVRRLAKKAGLEEGTRAFDLAVQLGMTMYEQDLDPYVTLKHSLPIVVSTARTPDELHSFLQLGIQLAEKRINPHDTLGSGIPAIVKAAETPEELNLFLQLGMKLAERRGSDPFGIYFSYGPVIRRTTKTPDGLRLSLQIGIKLAERGIYPYRIYSEGIPAIAKIARTPRELNLYLQFGLRLAERGINPVDIYTIDIPVIAEVAKTPGELESLLAFLENWTIRLREKRVVYGVGWVPIAANVAKTADELKSSLDCIGNVAIKLREQNLSPGILISDFLLSEAKTTIASEGDLLKHAAAVRKSLLEKRKSIPPTITTWEAHPTWPGPAEPYPIDDGWEEVTKTNPEYEGIQFRISQLDQLISALSPEPQRFTLAQQLQQAVQSESIEGWAQVAQRAQQLAGTDHPNLVTALQPLIAQTENYSGLTPDELEAQAEALIEEHGITDEDEVATLRLCLGLDWGQGLGQAIGDWRRRWREKTVRRLAKKAGLEEGTEEFDLAVRLGSPDIIKMAKTTEELKALLKSIEDLHTRLAEKGIGSRYALEHSIPAIAKAARTPEELTLFLQLGTRLAEKGIDPLYALEYGIPAIAKATKGPITSEKDLLKRAKPVKESLLKKRKPLLPRRNSLLAKLEATPLYLVREEEGEPIYEMQEVTEFDGLRWEKEVYVGTEKIQVERPNPKYQKIESSIERVEDSIQSLETSIWGVEQVIAVLSSKPIPASTVAALPLPGPLAQQLRQAVAAEEFEYWKEIAERAQQIAGEGHPNLVNALEVVKLRGYTGVDVSQLEEHAKNLATQYNLTSDETDVIRLCVGLDWGQGGGEALEINIRNALAGRNLGKATHHMDYLTEATQRQVLETELKDKLGIPQDVSLMGHLEFLCSPGVSTRVKPLPTATIAHTLLAAVVEQKPDIEPVALIGIAAKMEQRLEDTLRKHVTRAQPGQASRGQSEANWQDLAWNKDNVKTIHDKSVAIQKQAVSVTLHGEPLFVIIPYDLIQLEQRAPLTKFQIQVRQWMKNNANCHVVTQYTSEELNRMFSVGVVEIDGQVLTRDNCLAFLDSKVAEANADALAQRVRVLPLMKPAFGQLIQWEGLANLGLGFLTIKSPKDDPQIRNVRELWNLVIGADFDTQITPGILALMLEDPPRFIRELLKKMLIGLPGVQTFEIEQLGDFYGHAADYLEGQA